MMLPPVNLTAMGGADQEKQANMITARQSPGFPVVMEQVAHALTKRADAILLDYTREAVGIKYEVDGVWHDVPPRDRESGDAMLAVMKKLANLNPAERRARQEGRFGADGMAQKLICTITSQGTQTGERVLVRITPKKSRFGSLDDLGMRDKMRDQYKELINSGGGLIVFSAAPGHGLTTLWNVGLNATDRYTRDFVGVNDKDSIDEEIVNINPNTYDSKKGETPDTILRSVLLRLPEVLVVPEPTNAATLEAMCNHVIDEQKMSITRVVARDSVDALYRLLALKAPLEKFAKAIKFVISSRLTRKLCETCKQGYGPPPQLLQKLGIPPGRVNAFYREWQPPPPEQMVDEKGRPIEIPICPQCGGVGNIGRTGIFELLVIDDKMREALLKQQPPDVLRQLARQSGFRSFQEEGIVMLVKGTVSLTELQRVLKA
jgi:type II secretory ATPase GspE/PulE/Tfp pilus assembly ATPase PilB-like protein